jgi:hypothetical protein
MKELIQIIYVLKLYLDSNKNNFTPNYDKGLIRINKLLQDTYSKIQHYYYKYILYPELQYYLHS